MTVAGYEAVVWDIPAHTAGHIAYYFESERMIFVGDTTWPTTEGSGNPGASNVYRLAGAKAGLAVFLGDAAKGVAATAIGRAAGGPPLALACGVAAVLGHVFPVFRGFRGGRGVATAAGTVAVVEPLVAVPFVAAWLLIARLTGRASVASLVVIGATPVVVLALDRPVWEKLGMAGLAAVVVARHAGNLVRLARGDEPGLDHAEAGGQ